MALVITPVTATQATASSGVSNSTTSFSPGAGSMVRVCVSYLLTTNTTGLTFTCKDSSSTSYSQTVVETDTPGALYSIIFDHQYVSAPGSITVTITASSTVGADCHIQPFTITGQAASQAGAATGVATSAASSAICECSVTTTQAGSQVLMAGSFVSGSTPTPAGTTSTTATWNDAVTGAESIIGTSSSATVTPGATTFGWTLSPASAFGYSIAAAEVLPAAASVSVPAPQLQPGGEAFRRRYRRPQTMIPGVPAFTATAGLATAAGTAGTPGTGLQGGSATSTGAASGPGTGMTPALASGTGTAQTPAPALTPGLATATGTAFAPGSALTPGFATAAGTAFSVFPPVTVGFIPLQPGSQPWRHRFHRTQQRWTPTPSVSPALTVSGFGTFPQVPAGSVILAVIANITQHGSNAGVGAPAYQLWDGTAAQIGSAQTGTATTNVSNVDSVVFTGVTYSQLATLQLRIIADSAPGNTGSTTSVDAVSLSVEWAPNASVLITPDVLACTTSFPAPAVSVGVTATPGVLAATTVLPPAAAGVLAVNIFPGTLAATTVIPPVAASASVTVTPGVLAAATALPAITDVTAPGWASADAVTGSGNGAWSNIGNALGTPDGSNATWTAP